MHIIIAYNLLCSSGGTLATTAIILELSGISAIFDIHLRFFPEKIYFQYLNFLLTFYIDLRKK